ncbi:MAG: tetratricopeptide repeat protein [candidate division Zixibacteria bacterium]|nr:tetratricopeptide repeat protein [candidate division Zixibacteria bacterium]
MRTITDPMTVIKPPARHPRRALIGLALVVGMLLFTGCVYFNTFYNAKRAFGSAEKSRKNAGVRARGAGNADYKKAIEKALKVVDNYPKSKYYDDALFVLSVSYYHTEQFSKADRRFTELLTNYPESKYINESQLYLAKSKLAQKEYGEAMQQFEMVFSGNYDRDVKAEAALAIGEHRFSEKDYAGCRQYFQAVRDSLGNDDQKKSAQLFLADSYFEALAYRDGLSGYLQALEMKPNKDEKYHILVKAAQCAYRIQKISDGIDYLNQLLVDQLYFDSTGVLKLVLAQGHLYDEETDMAMRTYVDIAEHEKNTRITSEAYYNLGLIYQYQLDSLSQAKEFYDKCLAGNPVAAVRASALEKSSSIGKLKEFARQIKIDSTTTAEAIDRAAETQYQLAELYWFNLNKPDTAIIEMQYIIDSFPTSLKVPQAMIALSAMVRDYKADTAAADSILREVMARYPGTDITPVVLEELGLRGTDADSGYVQWYLGKAEDFLVDDTNLDSARYYYTLITEKYPESEIADQARFVLLWMTEEFDPPGDSSLILAYQQFVDSFPGTPWTALAKKKAQYTPARKGKGASGEIAGDESESDSTAPAYDSTRIYSVPDSELDSALADTTKKYVDPSVVAQIGPDGDTLMTLSSNIKPTAQPIQFVYPTEAYVTEWEGVLYFQVQLDFSGRVVDVVQKTFASIEEINKRALECVASMSFDRSKFPSSYTKDWWVYKFQVTLPSNLR